MAHASNVAYETRKSEENANVPLNAKHLSVKPPKSRHSSLPSPAVKLSNGEGKPKKRKYGQLEPSLEKTGVHNGELGSINPKRLKDGKKKPKRSKHVEQQEEELVDSDEGARMKKHGAIFSKFQKSVQLAEAEKKSVPPQAKQEDSALPAVVSELHGKFSILEYRKM